MSQYLIAAITSVCSLAGCSPSTYKASSSAEQQDFAFEGHPIHPAVVEDLNPPLEATNPVIVTVDLKAGHKQYS
jgi:hypothetical protein